MALHGCEAPWPFIAYLWEQVGTGVRGAVSRSNGVTQYHTNQCYQGRNAEPMPAPTTPWPFSALLCEVHLLHTPASFPITMALALSKTDTSLLSNPRSPAHTPATSPRLPMGLAASSPTHTATHFRIDMGHLSTPYATVPRSPSRTPARGPTTPYSLQNRHGPSQHCPVQQRLTHPHALLPRLPAAPPHSLATPYSLQN